MNVSPTLQPPNGLTPPLLLSSVNVAGPVVKTAPVKDSVIATPACSDIAESVKVSASLNFGKLPAVPVPSTYVLKSGGVYVNTPVVLS